MLIAFSGTHGTGKTTSVYNSIVNYKMSNPSKSVIALQELASESPFKINKETNEESQLWIFSNQMSKELEKTTKYNIVVSDRTIVDAIAYTDVAGFHDLANAMKEIAKIYISRYDKITFKTIRNNDYHFADGIRDGRDKEYRKSIETSLLKIYDELMPYIKEFCLD